MTLKEKLTYSFIAISVVLGSSVYASDDDSALFGPSGASAHTTTGTGPSVLADFDPSLLGSMRELLISQQQKKTNASHKKDSDGEEQRVASQQRIDLSSAAAAAAVKKDKDGDDEVGRTSAAYSGGMSVPQAMHLVTTLASGILGPDTHLQISKTASHAGKSSGGGVKRQGLLDLSDEEDEGTGRGMRHRDDRSHTRREDHHSDSHRSASRGVFQGPLKKDDSGIPDLLRLGLGSSSSSHSRTSLPSRALQEDDLHGLELQLTFLRHGGFTHPNVTVVAESLIESLLNERFRTAQEAGNVCIELLNCYSHFINTVKSKKGDIKTLCENRNRLVDYIGTKFVEDITFANITLNLIDQARFRRTVNRILTEELEGLEPEGQLILAKTKGSISLQYDTLTLPGVWVYQAVLMPITNVFIKTVDLREWTRIRPFIPTLFELNTKLVEAEGIYNLKESARHGKKAQVELNTWMFSLMRIPQALTHTSSAAAQEKVEKKTVADDRA